jgi:hypothetical protein
VLSSAEKKNTGEAFVHSIMSRLSRKPRLISKNLKTCGNSYGACIYLIYFLRLLFARFCYWQTLGELLCGNCLVTLQATAPKPRHKNRPEDKQQKNIQVHITQDYPHLAYTRTYIFNSVRMYPCTQVQNQEDHYRCKTSTTSSLTRTHRLKHTETLAHIRQTTHNTHTITPKLHTHNRT